MSNHKNKQLWIVHEKQKLNSMRQIQKELGMLRPFPNSTLFISRYTPAN